MVTADLFRQAMGNWCTGVTIVATAGNGGKPYGLTASSFTSVSLNPPLILVCLDNRISGLQSFKDSGKFGVSVLSEDQAELSTLFAKKDSGASGRALLYREDGCPSDQGIARRYRVQELMRCIREAITRFCSARWMLSSSAQLRRERGLFSISGENTESWGSPIPPGSTPIAESPD